MRRRAPLTIVVAAAAATALLVGCSGPANSTVPGSGPVAPAETGYEIPETGTTSTPEREPNHYEARVIDVLAGDKLRVQVTDAVYLSKGERTLIPSDLGTIVVKDPTYDAPASGECGYEESRDHLITGAFLQDLPWNPDTNKVMITIGGRDRLDEAGIPATDGDTHLMMFNHQWESPGSYMLGNGYARVGELLNSDYFLYGTLQEGQRRGSERGLWQTCWGE